MLYLVPCPDFYSPTWRWLLTNGDTVASQGESSTQELPADEPVCLIVPANRLSWHRLQIPKIASTRLRAALNGLLEDRLLDPPEQLHFALEPGFKPGQPEAQWLAACDRESLQLTLNTLLEAGRHVVRILPEILPTDRLCVQVHEQGQEPWLSASSPNGIWSCPLPEEGALSDVRAWFGTSIPTDCYATPGCAVLAEHHFPDWTWTVEPRHSAWLRSAKTNWNLAQFELRFSPQNRRRASVKQWGSQFLKDPAWSSVRWGLGALIAVQLLGLNAVAWQERRVINGLEQEMHQLLQTAVPGTTLVLDAPQQLERAWLQARASNGTPSGSDPESLLQALDRGLSGSTLRVVRLEYNPKRSVVGLSGSSSALAERINQGLAGSGWKAQAQGNDLTMTWSTP